MKTVKVRIAAIVNTKGEWYAVGFAEADEVILGNAQEGLEPTPNERCYFIEAELPVPEMGTITVPAANVTEAAQ